MSALRTSAGPSERNAVRLIADPDLAGISGRYFDRDREARAHRQAYDMAARVRLRELSRDLCGFADP